MAKWLKKNAPTVFHMVLILILTVLLLMSWFVLMVKASSTEQESVRAVTAVEHDVCMELPRGSQVMEEKRQGCFHKLYGSGRFGIDRELVARD